MDDPSAEILDAIERLGGGATFSKIKMEIDRTRQCLHHEKLSERARYSNVQHSKKYGVAQIGTETLTRYLRRLVKQDVVKHDKKTGFYLRNTTHRLEYYLLRDLIKSLAQLQRRLEYRDYVNRRYLIYRVTRKDLEFLQESFERTSTSIQKCLQNFDRIQKYLLVLNEQAS